VEGLIDGLGTESKAELVSKRHSTLAQQRGASHEIKHERLVRFKGIQDILDRYTR
jgi:hypothetical protein